MLTLLIPPCLEIAWFNWCGEHNRYCCMIGQQANQLVSRLEEGGESETGRCQKCSGDFNASYVQCVNVGGWFSADTLHREHQYQRNRTLVGVQPSSQSVRRQDSSDLSQQTPHLLISESCLG